MNSLKKPLPRNLFVAGVAGLLVCLGVAALVARSGSAFAQQQPAKQVDKRRLTTIQTSSVDVNGKKNAVEVRYLNLPFGQATFNYIESGVDQRNGNYYSSRTWPIAHLRLATPATYEGKALAPGDYVLFITPKNPEKNTGMTLSVASFKPAGASGTFLVPGNVFVETPKDAQVVAQREVTFAQGAPLVDHLEIKLAPQGDAVAMNVHYGDRTLTEKLMLK